MAAEIWESIHSERAKLLPVLEELTPEQWASSSRCGEWTVRDVVGHMVSTMNMTAPKFFGGIAKAGFSFQKFAHAGLSAEARQPTDELVDRFRSSMTSTKHPPGPTASWLGETIVHSDDAIVPLGLSVDHDRDACVTIANFYKSTNLLIGTKKRISGLRLQATDVEWTAGDGPEVKGTIIDLLSAMTGRAQMTGSLDGEGAESLRKRLS